MRKVFKNKSAFWLIVTVLILGIAIGVLNAAKTEVSFLENATEIVFTPIQKLFTNIGDGVSGFFGYFSDKQALHKEIEALKTENAELKQKVTENEASKLENDELRKLLNLKSNTSGFELEAAEIIARNPSNWYNTITISKGAADGIALNQPVVSTGNTLVGRISEVGTTWSRVTLLTDPEHSAGARVLRSGEDNICEGDSNISDEAMCRLSFLSKNANIIVGDTIITSGLGGIYPKGLIIGKVQEVRQDIQGISQYAVVKPEADFKNIKVVFVILNANE